ncbi:unnamed protein product, partial [Didymodactylos carnosus]
NSRPGKRQSCYEKSPLEISKDKKYVTVADIARDPDDPYTKKREIIPYSGRVSRTLIDRGYAEVD